jgi:hypothetical protein
MLGLSCSGINTHGELGRGSVDQNYAASALERVPGLSRVAAKPERIAVR